MFGSDDVLVMTTGSFARREACGSSDLDFFAICRPGDEQRVAARLNDDKVRADIAHVVSRQPALGGAFGGVEILSTMLTNIGGQNDDNAKITRRMLLLLEGEWLFNETMFQDVRSQVLGLYLRDTMLKDKIARFLLNDIIRYYRTISIDFEHKTAESAKPWGIRYIKLVFPRKLLYFSGILAVAQTRDLDVTEKRARLSALFDLPVVERVHRVCGAAALPALKLYDSFLGTFERPDVRAELNQTSECRRAESEIFNALKQDGQELTRLLHDALRKTYPDNHPIHLALFA